MPYANEGYKNQKWLLCGLDYHGMVIDNITFDKKLWESMKSKFEIFYKYFYLNSFFSN